MRTTGFSSVRSGTGGKESEDAKKVVSIVLANESPLQGQKAAAVQRWTWRTMRVWVWAWS